MCWLKRNRWKGGIAVGGLVLLLVLMVLVPVSAVGAHEGASELATPVTVTVQATPTIDATVTALNKEKLQNGNDWLWNYGAVILSSVLSALVLVIGVLIGFWQWRMNRDDIRAMESKDRQKAQDKELKDREDERRKETAAQDKELRDRAEERFQTAVTALGDEKEGTQVGGTILLRSFLHEDDEKIYGRYYTQIFDLAVANLRLRHFDNDTPEPLTSLSQALIDVFKESLRLARKQPRRSSLFLDASRIQLDNAYLAKEDLREVWLPEASLRKANLIRTNFTKAVLYGAKLSDAVLSSAQFLLANLRGANLTGADLTGANLAGANLQTALLGNADLSRAVASDANFCFAWLGGTSFKEADLSGSDFRGADLRGADLREADLSKADLRGFDQGESNPGRFIPILLEKADFRGADLRGAKFDQTTLAYLKDTNLCGVKGLTKEQLEACKANGAIIDEDNSTGSTQSDIAHVQVNTPTPSTDGSSGTSSQPSAEP